MTITVEDTGHQFQIDESDRQALILALAILSKRSPGFDWMNGNIAGKLGGHLGRKMFEDFKSYNTHLGAWPTISGAALVPMTNAELADATKAVALAAPDSSVEEWAPPAPNAVAENVVAERLPDPPSEFEQLEAVENQALALCHAIEKLPASVEQTDLITAASETRRKVQQMILNKVEVLRELTKKLQADHDARLADADAHSD